MSGGSFVPPAFGSEMGEEAGESTSRIQWYGSGRGTPCSVCSWGSWTARGGDVTAGTVPPRG